MEIGLKTRRQADLNLLPVTLPHGWIIEVCNQWNCSSDLIHLVATDFENLPVLFLLSKAKTIIIE